MPGICPWRPYPASGRVRDADFLFVFSEQQCPRIKGIIERLCGCFGEPVGEGLYGFPARNGWRRWGKGTWRRFDAAGGAPMCWTRRESGVRRGGPGRDSRPAPLDEARGFADDQGSRAQGSGVRAAVWPGALGGLSAGRMDETGHEAILSGGARRRASVPMPGSLNRRYSIIAAAMRFRYGAAGRKRRRRRGSPRGRQQAG